jgi:subtilase family serine protease
MTGKGSMKRFTFAAVAAIAALAAGCGGGGGGAHTMPSTVNSNPLQPAAVPPQLQIANWGQGIMQGAMYVGPVSNASLSVIVQVHQQNAQGLAQYAQMANDPSSPYFHKWLTPQDIAARYGASQSDYQKVAAYFQQNGLAVAGWPQRLVLVVSGTQSSVEHAFNTTLGLYQRDGKQFIAPRVAPHFSQQLPVDAIGRIADFRPNHTYMLPGSPRAGAGYANGFSPSTIQGAFDFIGAIKAGYDGTGTTVGIIGTGPINTQAAAPGDVDLANFASATNARVATVTEHLVTNAGVAAGLASPTPPIPPSQFPYAPNFTATPAPPWASQNEDGEAQLDTQQAASLAPGANIAFFFAYNSDDCAGANFSGSSPCPTSGSNAGKVQFGITEADAEIQQAIGENSADVLSLSYGGGETQQGFGCYSGCATPYQGSYSQEEYAALAAEGIAVFASSGDSGSAECYDSNNNVYLPQQCVSYPAADPNVTSVGGITTNVDLSGSITAPWLAWGIDTSDTGYGGQQGSGGGTAALLPAPTWQQTALGTTLREQPDLSLEGDPSTGVATLCEKGPSTTCTGSLGIIGGTSVAAPEMAAMWADVESACKQHPGVGACAQGSGPNAYRLGNPGPYIYAIYKGTSVTANGVTWTPYLDYAHVFYDIVYGDNQMSANPGASNPVPASPVPGDQAGPGYDEVTGLGVPFAGHLIDALIPNLNVQ